MSADPETCFGQVEHYEIPGSTGAMAVGVGAWPQFHHDAALTGNAEQRSQSRPLVHSAVGRIGRLQPGAVRRRGLLLRHHPVLRLDRQPPSLNAPIVGMAMAPSVGGYWLVASDGGIFAYGGARFYGSMGGRPLNKPIVGMSATPDGKGYWEVASDGGIFAFGDARFYGSTGSLTLQQPIVGMVATPDGPGYRLVAGRRRHLRLRRQPVLRLDGRPAPQPAHRGHGRRHRHRRLLAGGADGGIFAFNAPFYGSMGGHPSPRRSWA